MAEYIEREALRDALYDADAITMSGVKILNQFPGADVAPVRHGRWESVKNPQWPAYSHDKCSLCGWWNTKNALCYDGRKKPGHALNYCPNCGADMRGSNDE